MISMPQASRLSGKITFKLQEAGDWIFAAHDVYCDLLSEQLPHIIRKSNTGWKKSRYGNDRKFAYFKGLSDDEINEINEFVRDFSHYVIIGLNKNLKDAYSDELDFCLCLDFTWVDGKAGDVRTPTGEKVYAAKYQSNNAAIDWLAVELAKAFNRLPETTTARPVVLTCIPCSPDKKFDLPSVLCRKLVALLVGREFEASVAELCLPKLLRPKPDYKNAHLARKAQIWRTIYKRGWVSLDCDLQDRVIYIIDDLYQPGRTIWAYADFLKQKGAKTVVGLVCEKTFSDSSN